MKNDILNNDIAFSSMLDAIEIMNEDEEHIAEVARELDLLKRKKEKDFKRVRQYAANYFTEDKISELHRLNQDVLKSSDFNKEEYIEIFSDNTKIRIGDIDFLIEIQNNIIEVQEKLNSNKELSSEDQVQVRGVAKIMSTIADILSRKDGANND